ncbi:hypothetical protein [Streptomyces olivaceiscleroticus]|uniref:Uncharacterized protein n=1 Tax=Streptomyces olivaceiscleroticus TaxID=68245 RepID=A0ABN1BM94_9ACTN
MDAFPITTSQAHDAAHVSVRNTLLASLTDRERALVEDVAVMGYVCGITHPKEQAIPSNEQILAEVVDACLTSPDLYPAINVTGSVCVECGHPTKQHTKDEDPVTPGQCRQRATQGAADHVWHDYQPPKDA